VFRQDLGLAQVSSAPVALPEPWEKQDNESQEAWLAFRAYRDMPPDERLLKRAAIGNIAVLSRWYRDHNWADRCAAFDKKFDAMRVEEREKVYRRAAREIAIDHMVMLADARELYSREFAKLLSASREGDMIGLVKPETLVRMAEVMVKLDRLVRGESTENVQNTDMDLSQLSLDELRQLNELMSKASKPKDESEESDRVARH
jgi:hypothetical protein